MFAAAQLKERQQVEAAELSRNIRRHQLGLSNGITAFINCYPADAAPHSPAAAAAAAAAAVSTPAGIAPTAQQQQQQQQQQLLPQQQQQQQQQMFGMMREQMLQQ